MTFWGVFGPPSCCFSYMKGPKHPLKKSYRKCFRRTQIRWVIWRSSRRAVPSARKRLPTQDSGESKWGLSKWGLKVLVHKRPRLPTIVVILRRKSLFWPVFTRPFFLFAPFAGHPSSSPFLSTFSPFFPPSKSALFCRAKGTAQSLERGSSGMDLSTKFGKEIPSRNLRKKRSVLEKEKNHKSSQLYRIVRQLQRVALSPPFKSPHFVFPERLGN